MISSRDFARSLRKTPSRAECTLWKMLRDRGVGAKFRRQHPIEPYVADFACVEAKLIVEVDGLSHDVAEQAAHDVERTRILEQAGWRVMRVRDAAIFSDASAVLATIKQALAR